MKVFIPISDEMLMDGIIPHELVAYHPGMLMLAQEPTPEIVQSKSTVNRSPSSTPSSDAVPAFNSSTNFAGTLLG
jgi:hypothetical protein